jgi:hypothetical protein
MADEFATDPRLAVAKPDARAALVPSLFRRVVPDFRPLSISDGEGWPKAGVRAG